MSSVSGFNNTYDSENLLDLTNNQEWKRELNVALIIRQKGSRRFDLPIHFPLEDSQGVFVIQDRRRLLDRRKEKYGLDDLKVILTKMEEN